MSCINSYIPPPTANLPTYGPDPYDVNFVYPLPERLETARVKLTPFIPGVHAQLYFDCTISHPSLYDHLPFSFATLADLLGFLENGMRRNCNNILFAIIDKTRVDPKRPEMGGSLAGMIGLVNTSVGYMAIDIGPIVVIPAFQRTHVTKNAIGILLRFCMELPNSTPTRGLGLRRVAWLAKPDNSVSIGVAQQMGMKKEGLLRWTFVCDGEGMKSREGDPNQRPGRDCVLLAMTWEDWEYGGRDIVQRAMDSR